MPGLTVERCGNPFRIRQVPVGFSLRKAVLDVSLLNAFRKRLAARRHCVVHAVEEAAWLAALLCPAYGVPYIYDMASAIPEQLSGHTLFGSTPPQAVLRAAERRVIDRAAHVVCSGGLGSRVSGLSPGTGLTEWRFPAPEGNPDPRLVTHLRTQHAIEDTDRVLLYTGNFSSYQGIDLLLEGFVRAAASDPQLLLVCVGASDARDTRKVASRVPDALSGRVRVVPRQRRTLMPAWLAAADCLLSLRPAGSNIPLKVFEYMAARRPIIATRGPAHEPLLDDSRAFLCAPRAADVAASIRSVFTEDRQARRVADAAAHYAASHFSWPGFRQLVAGVYRQVLHPHMPKPVRS